MSKAPLATEPEILAAYNDWWRGLCLQGDPIRRPYLIQEAFLAGMKAGSEYLSRRAREREEPLTERQIYDATR